MDEVWKLTAPGRMSLTGTRFEVVYEGPAAYGVHHNGAVVPCSGLYRSLTDAQSAAMRWAREAQDMGIEVP